MNRAAVSGVMCCAATLLLHAQAPPADRSRLNGAWVIEEPIEPEREVNWRRPTPARSIASDGSGRGGGMVPTKGNLGISTLHTFGKTLIAPSTRLKLQVGPKSVLIDDDFFVPTSFGLGWPGHRLSVPTSQSGDTHRTHYTTVVVKTSWQDDALVQDLSNTSGFRMTRVWKLAEDGRRLLMLIQIKEPKLTPPVEDITRAYVREGK